MGIFKKLKFWNNQNETRTLKKQLEEERSRNYKEERWLLQQLMDTDKELQQVKAEKENAERDCQHQVVEVTKHFVDQLYEERKEYLSERERLSQDLCKARTDLEEMKAVMEKVERGCEQQVEEARTHFMDQLAEEMKKEEIKLLRALCAPKDAEVQKRHEELDQTVKQLYKCEHKPASSTWQKVFLLLGGAVLGVVFTVLMGFCPIELEGEISFCD